MPPLTRNKTGYPGVFFIEKGAKHRAYYIRYRVNGKMIEEKTPAKSASQANRIRVRRLAGEEPSNHERRAVKKQQKRWTVEQLAEEYFSTLPDEFHLRNERCRFNQHLRKRFGSMTLEEISPLDVERFKRELLKKRKPATVKRVLEFLRRISNFGAKMKLCEGLGFTIEMPKFDNKRTEFLTPEQVSALIRAANEDEDANARGIVLTALYTGIRRGAIFKLRWEDVDFNRGLIFLREPKGGRTGEVDVIPMNSAMRKLLENHPRTDSPYVFPGSEGNKRVDFKRAWRRIKKRAMLPETFRFHDLRHTYASLLASSGKVNLYMLQKLLTHRTPEMTQRYAHLLDSALRDAAEVAVEVIDQARSSFSP